jgi:glycosyl transferase family 87
MQQLLRYKYYLLAIGAALVYILAQSRFEHGDFNVFMGAADYLKRGQNPYNVWLVWNSKVTDMYAYGPAFACMLIPLTYLPPPVPFIVFFMAQMLLLIRVFVVIERMLPLSTLTQKQKAFWWLLSIGCSLRFVLHNVEFGQITILILFLAIEGLYQIFYGNKLWGSLLLGLGIHIKLMPLVFIPYLVWRKEFAAATLCIFFAALFWLTPLAFGNTFFTTGLFLDWCSTINPFGDKIIQHQENLSYSMQGLQALLSAYLLDSKIGDLGFKFNLVVLSLPVFQTVLQVSRLLFILFTLYFLKGTFLQPYQKGPRDFWQLSYLFLVIPIIFPQQQKYSLILMAPFFCYMIWWLITTERKENKRWRVCIFWFGAIVALTTFTSDLFVGFRLNYVFQCLRLLTIAAILAVPLLAFAKPVNASES